MSGHSDSTNCPNCGEVADQYTDWKPFSYTEISCLHCGLVIKPTSIYMLLDELNERRETEGHDTEEPEKWPQLTKAPRQEFKV